MTRTQPLPQIHAGFEFVRALAAELTSGRIDFPPLRTAGLEPASAARLVSVANTPSVNRSGRQITDLRTAVDRLGQSMVLSAGIASAISRLCRDARGERLRSRLNKLWQRSAKVAALAYVLARTCSAVDLDEALLAGMLHGVGKLYILTLAGQHPQLFTDSGTLDEILCGWHGSIGRAILENWGFAGSMCSAIGEQDDHAREEEIEPDLRDVVAIAILMASYPAAIPNLELALNGLPSTVRLGLDQARIRTVMLDCAAEVSALSEAFSSEF